MTNINIDALSTQLAGINRGMEDLRNTNTLLSDKVKQLELKIEEGRISKVISKLTKMSEDLEQIINTPEIIKLSNHPNFHTSNDLNLWDALQSINEVLTAFEELKNETH